MQIRNKWLKEDIEKKFRTAYIMAVKEQCINVYTETSEFSV